MAAAHNLVAGWEAKDIVSAALATFAFTLSIANFARTSRVADRQFAQGYFQEVAKWLATVLSLLEEARGLLPDVEYPEVNQAALKDVCYKLLYQSNVGLMLFGPPDTVKDDGVEVFNYPAPVAIVMEQERYLWRLTAQEVFSPSLIDSARLMLASNELIGDVTSAFDIKRRVLQATRGRLLKRKLEHISQ